MDGFPHEKREALEYGRSPGNGVTAAPLSREPLASEGEATPGPDDENPYDKREARREREKMLGDGDEVSMPDFGMAADPTEGDDPFAFDDVGDDADDRRLPQLGDGPGPSLPF